MTSAEPSSSIVPGSGTRAMLSTTANPGVGFADPSAPKKALDVKLAVD
jgi:hypothetical protein